MKVCLSVYNLEMDSMGYTTSKAQDASTLLYYSEEANPFEFGQIECVLEKTLNLYGQKVLFEGKAAQVAFIEEIDCLELCFQCTFFIICDVLEWCSVRSKV